MFTDWPGKVRHPSTPRAAQARAADSSLPTGQTNLLMMAIQPDPSVLLTLDSVSLTGDWQ